MSKDKITYSDVTQQIKKLKAQGLTISDEDFAAKTLRTWGYSNLIKSYRDPYVITINDHKVYRNGVTFEQIYSLYLLDKNLRNAVIASMLDLEEHIKTITADVISCDFGIHQDDYLCYRNYRDKTRSGSRFSLSNILATMNKVLTKTDKNPVKYYRENYTAVPPWILFKSVYFSTIVNFIKLFKTPQQNKFVNMLYGSHEDADYENLRKLMLDTLFICLEYRNLAAHGGRIYNYICDSTCRVIDTLSGFSQLLYLLNLLEYKLPFQHLQQVLEREVNRHCNQYPQDVTYLGQILNINIEAHHIVWIANNSKKFHTNPHCSGIKDAQQAEYSDELKKMYSPCRRCSQIYYESNDI